MASAEQHILRKINAGSSEVMVTSVCIKTTTTTIYDKFKRQAELNASAADNFQSIKCQLNNHKKPTKNIPNYGSKCANQNKASKNGVFE